MIDLNNALELRDLFFNFASENLKEIKKEISKDNIEVNDRYIEWYLFEKIFSDGKLLIDEFLEKKTLTEEEKELISSWKKFVFGIFKVKKETDEDIIFLNMTNNIKYSVKKKSFSKSLKQGSFILTRLIPFHKDYIVANSLYKLGELSNDRIYNLVARFELDFPNTAFVDNQTKMEVSYRIQEIEYDDFVTFFGSDEIIVDGVEISDRLSEFYHYRYFQKKDLITEKTIAKLFREKYGTFPDLPIINLPEHILSLGDVGVLYDKLEGLNFLPWYGIFKEIFRTNDFKEIPGYKKCVMGYLESESISTLPFKKVLKQYPENLIEVFKDIFKRKRFRLPEDFNKIMLKYKHSYLDEFTVPSVIPVVQKAKALLRTKHPEEYINLHFNQPVNDYKDFYKMYELND